MVRNLELRKDDPGRQNFFNLLHPLHLESFRNLVVSAAAGSATPPIELYVRNGHYHPMKWEVKCVSENGQSPKKFLCVGHSIIDEDRIHRFNQLVRNNSVMLVEGLNGLFLHDTYGELIAANQKAASIYNISLETLYQLKGIPRLWDEEWNIRNIRGQQVMFAQSPIHLAAATGQPQEQTLVVTVPGDEMRWIRFYSQPFVDQQNDDQLSVLTNIVDVTREEKLSRDLQQKDQLIGSFIQESPLLAWVIDEDANLHFASRAFYRHFRLDETACRGKKVTDIIPEAVLSVVYDKHVEVLETAKALQTTEKVKWADGSTFISYVNIFPLGEANGKRLVGGSAFNLPDKSKLEKELHEVQERLLTLSRATSDAIWEWDMQSGQIFRNETLMEMIGYQLDNSRGLSWWLRRIHPDDRNRVADKVKEATDLLQQSWQDEYRFKCADGSYKDVQDRGFVVYENGLPVKMIGSLQDVSTLKKLQTELADERLQRQKEIAETIVHVQEKERTQIGHELHDNVNQILSTAKLFLDIIQPSGKEQEQAKEKSTSYLLMAIEEIRKLSKELAAPQLKSESLIDSILHLKEDISMAHKMKISFTYNTESALMTPGKKVTIFRIAQEQLKNIIKHSEATLTTINLDTRDEEVCLTIEDNGKGFDPRRSHQGIGLSNIHERAQFYNGRTHIQAAPGKGCKLVVTIPLAD